jgi:hypothetical protein
MLQRHNGKLPTAAVNLKKRQKNHLNITTAYCLSSLSALFLLAIGREIQGDAKNDQAHWPPFA